MYNLRQSSSLSSKPKVITHSSHYRAKHDQPVQKSPIRKHEKSYKGRVTDHYPSQPNTSRAASSMEPRRKYDFNNVIAHRPTPTIVQKDNLIDDSNHSIIFESHNFNEPVVITHKKNSTPNVRHSVVSAPSKPSTIEKLNTLWAKISYMNDHRLDMLIDFVKKLDQNSNEKHAINILSDIIIVDIKIYSTWGSIDCVGLTEIQIFDENGNKVDINPSSVIIKNCSSQCHVESMMNGVMQTIDAKNMALFSTSLKAPLIISMPIKHTNISAILIWNYNNDVKKGAKSIEIYKESKIIWKGDLKQGTGDSTTEYFNEVTIIPEVRIKKPNRIHHSSHTSRAKVSSAKDTIELLKEQAKASEHGSQSIQYQNSEVRYQTEPREREITQPVKPPEDMPEKIFRRKSRKCLKIMSPSQMTNREETKEKHIEQKHNAAIQFNEGNLENKPFPSVQEIEKMGKQIRLNDHFIPSLVCKEADNSEEIALDALLSDVQCDIPTNPIGRNLTIFIYSTWGDKDFIGLMGLEFWNSAGHKISIPEHNITADPPDFNVLTSIFSTTKDGRVVSNLIKGNNFFTCDQSHCWMAPFTNSRPNKISIDFGGLCTLGMIRIWNYNKSRIYTNRGAKDVEILLDKKLIFKGEIKKASGNLKSLENCFEALLFTNDASVISKISSEDWTKSVKLEEMGDSFTSLYRPSTANKQQDPNYQSNSCAQPAHIEQINANMVDAKYQGFYKNSNKAKPEAIYVGAIEINIIENWGDPHYTGLTGIELYDESNQYIRVDMSYVSANPSSINSPKMPVSDIRTIDKLFNGVNITENCRNMWLIPYTFGQPHRIWINLPFKRLISKIKFYNYNKSQTDAYRGVKKIELSINGKLMTNKDGLFLRMAPGSADFDYGQEFTFPLSKQYEFIPKDLPIQTVAQSQDYLTLTHPIGMLLKITLISNHGDPYYIGLNGIDIVDSNAQHLLHSDLVSYRIFGSSVALLPGMEKDVRVLKNLIDGVNVTKEDKHIWLAPFNNIRTCTFANASIETSVKPNAIYILFDRPINISMITFYNYTKTPERGMNELELCFDHKVIYKGYIKKAIVNKELDAMSIATSILFTNDSSIIKQSYLPLYELKGQSVLLTNDGKILNLHEMAKMPCKMAIDRPLTSND